jgi:serine protease Do
MGLQLRELASWAQSRKLLTAVLVMLTLSIGILIGTLVSGHAGATRAILANGGTPLVLPSPVEMSHAFSGIVKRDEPAIVNISTTQVITRETSPRQHSGTGADPFQDFFNRFFDAPSTGPQAERSLGSGMLTDKKGFILTNRHVIEQATKIQVQLADDPTLYTAAIPKRASGRLGHGHRLAVRLQETVTLGIISAKERDVDPGQQFQHFLQTDAAINPGNSGGPLLNINGEVVGINTAIASRSGGYQGIGFALPINEAVKVYNDIIKNGKVVRGSIGSRSSPEARRIGLVSRPET